MITKVKGWKGHVVPPPLKISSHNKLFPLLLPIIKTAWHKFIPALTGLKSNYVMITLVNHVMKNMCHI